MRTRTLCLLGTVIILYGFASYASAVTPKPWQWTPRQAMANLNQTKPEIHPGIDGSSAEMTGVSACRGLGMRVAGRFVSFRCMASFQATSGQSERRPLWAKVRKVGRGQLCVSLTSKVPGGCLATSGAVRILGTSYDAAMALRRWLPARMGGDPRLAQGNFTCLGHGAGFYACSFDSTRDGTATVTLTMRGPRFAELVFST